jgi:hypothetical protein
VGKREFPALPNKVERGLQKERRENFFEEAKAQLETAWRQWLARSKLDERYDWVLLILRSDSLGSEPLPTGRADAAP